MVTNEPDSDSNPRRTARAGPVFRTPIHPAVAPSLSFVAGFCDATSFIALDHLFVAHVTGNIIVIGAEAWVNSENILAKIIAIPVFLMAAAITMLAVRWARRRGHHVLHAALYVEAFLLLCFLIACLISLPRSAPLDWNDVVAGMIGVAAMGTQVALMRLALPAIAPTNFMTGTVVQITLDLIHCTGRGIDDLSPEERQIARTRAIEGLRRLAGFVVGAVLAGIAYFVVDIWALVVPFLVVLAVAILHPRPK